MAVISLVSTVCFPILTLNVAACVFLYAERKTLIPYAYLSFFLLSVLGLLCRFDLSAVTPLLQYALTSKTRLSEGFLILTANILTVLC
jgi:hypothetical protein